MPRFSERETKTTKLKRTPKPKSALKEYNLGLQLHLLKDDSQEWKRLRAVLNEQRKSMEQLIEKGTEPLFGYPTVLYDEFETGKWPFMKTLTENVISSN